MAQAVKGPYMQGWEAGRRITDDMIERAAQVLDRAHESPPEEDLYFVAKAMLEAALREKDQT